MSSLYTIQAYPSHTIHINTHQYTSIHINTHQYTSIHINTHQYTSLLTQKKIENIRRVPRFLGSPLWPLPPCHRGPGAARGAPRRQRHRPGGRPRSPRGDPAPAADGARRRGREGRQRVDSAARGGVPRPRGDLPGAAGGGGRDGRQGQQRPLGPEKMDTRCLGQISGCKKKSNSTCDMQNFGWFWWVW